MIIKNKIEEMELTVVNAELMDMMLNNLKAIYENKSSDEYKMSGDITKSPSYNDIEVTLAELRNIKGINSVRIEDLKTMFNTLHKPIWKKLVTEYCHEPNERNIIFTAIFTSGYRVLVGEVGRILASIEYTTSGKKYKPDKISKKEDKGWFIRCFVKDIDKTVDDYIVHERKNKKNTAVQEAAAIDAISAIGSRVIKIVPETFRVLSSIFSTAKELNPIALINATLTRNYDKKVKKCNEVQATYYAAKKAYDEYMSQPGNQRNKHVEKNYLKQIEKYEIKMNNLKAQIAHYDSRSNVEVEDVKKKSKKSFFKKDKKESSTTTTTTKASETSTTDNNTNDDKKESSNDDFDF